MFTHFTHDHSLARRSISTWQGVDCTESDTAALDPCLRTARSSSAYPCAPDFPGTPVSSGVLAPPGLNAASAELQGWQSFVSSVPPLNPDPNQRMETGASSLFSSSCASDDVAHRRRR